MQYMARWISTHFINEQENQKLWACLGVSKKYSHILLLLAEETIVEFSMSKLIAFGPDLFG